jgi:outer membrane protein TolC
MIASREWASWAAAGLAAVLAGCVSAPTPSASDAPWRPPARAQQRDEVWQTIRAEQPDLAKPLSLAALADLALRHNPATRTAWNDARAAAAQVKQAEGYFMPTVIGTVGANRQYTTAEPDKFDQDFLKYNPGLQVNYLILNFGGGREAAVEAALQTVYAADYAFNRALQTVLLNVETAYYQLISARAGTEAAEANVKDTQATLDAARERLAAGVGTQLEVLQAQAGHDQARYGLVNAQGTFQMARGALAQTVGLPADAPIEIGPPAADAPAGPSQANLRTLIDDALQRRPDIAALRATLAAKKALVTAVGSELWPSLYLTGSATRNVFDFNRGQDTEDRDWAYFGSLSLRWTLFDGFQTLNAKRVAEARAETAQAQLKQAELAASAEVWSRYFGYETALQKHAASAAFLKSAAAAHDAALDSYKAGLKSILDVLNTESQVAQARSQQVAARQEVFTALAQLAYATGLLEKDGAMQTQDTFSNPPKKDR